MRVYGETRRALPWEIYNTKYAGYISSDIYYEEQPTRCKWDDVYLKKGSTNKTIVGDTQKTFRSELFELKMILAVHLASVRNLYTL